MEMLTRDAILKAEDLPTEDVAAPEWGGTVRVRTMRGDERDRYDQECSDSRKASKDAGQGDHEANVRARLAAWAIVDADGNRIFTTADVEALGQKSSKVLDRIVDVAVRLNGVGKAEIEDLAKNSEPEASADSHSD